MVTKSFLPFLMSIDFQAFHSTPGGLSPELINRLRYVFIKVTEDDVDAACTFCRDNPSLLIHADVSELSSNDAILNLQNAGVARVFITAEQLESLCLYSPLIFGKRVAFIMRKDMRATENNECKDFTSDISSALYYGKKDPEIGCCYVDFGEVEWKYFWGPYGPKYFLFPDAWDNSLFYEAPLRGYPIIDSKRLFIGDADTDTTAEKLSIVRILFGSLEERCRQQLGRRRPDDTDLNTGQLLYESKVFDEEGAQLSPVFDETTSILCQRCFSSSKTLAETLNTGNVTLHQLESIDWLIGFRKYGEEGTLVPFGSLVRLECDPWKGYGPCLRFIVKKA